MFVGYLVRVPGLGFFLKRERKSVYMKFRKLVIYCNQTEIGVIFQGHWPLIHEELNSQSLWELLSYAKLNLVVSALRSVGLTQH